MPSPAYVTLDALNAQSPDATPLFVDLTLAFGRERTGLVGRNGVGKTTLLRLIAGEIEPMAGAVARAGTIGLLRQTAVPHGAETVLDTLRVAAPMAVIRRILAGEGEGDDLTDADWTLEDRVEAALADVGLAGLAHSRPTASLSGGEQTRLRLAALMLARPDLLLLDEPTNHMDAAARALVADVVARWPGGVVVVSHDRALLLRMDRIVELSSLGTSVYGGGYDLYAECKATEREAAQRDLDNAERSADQVARDAQRAVEKKARRDAAGRRFAASGSLPPILAGLRADRAEDSGGRGQALAVRRATEVEAALSEARERVERVRALSIPMPPTGLAAGRMVLEMEAVSFRFPSPLNGKAKVIGPISLRLTGPERMAITGPNGAGKTTLLKLIAGVLEPTSGRVARPVTAALLDQDAAILRPHETLIDAYRRLNPEAGVNAAHAALARFLFRNTAATKRVSALSGGERLRAALACVMTGAHPPQLLVLDEPTNHLDLDAIEAVEAALSAYDGALVVVSHDADFLNAIDVERRLEL
jgi:ATPase subunit of ABC transporter with duplicated ATPase domains